MPANMSQPISYVAVGDPQRGWCENCQTGGLVLTVMYALDESGPIPLGVFGHCACGISQWQCRYCQQILAVDGGEVFEHVRDQHSRAAEAD